MRGPRRVVDGPALVVCDLDVPCGGEGLAGGARAPGPALAATNTDPTAVPSFPSEASSATAVVGAAQDLDDASESRAAVEVGGPALQDLDPLDGGPGTRLQ